MRKSETLWRAISPGVQSPHKRRGVKPSASNRWRKNSNIGVRPPTKGGETRSARPLPLHGDAVENVLGDLDHGDAAAHRGPLHLPEGLRLSPAVALHQHALGPLDNLTVLQRLLQGGVGGGE